MFDRPAVIAERRSIRLGEREVDFILKRSVNRRRAALTVDEQGLTVSVPWRTSDRYIAGFLRDSAGWIVRKLEAWAARRPQPRSWCTGELVDFLGRQLRLAVSQQPYTLVQLSHGDSLSLTLPHPEDTDAVRSLVVKWYRRHAQAHFRARVEHYSEFLGIQAPRVFLSNAATRWGSCNANGQVRLNWRLMQAATHVVDYVVAHELAHLREMNHSVRFWRVVQRLCPDYLVARAELNAMGEHYMAL